jgi:hypothetical protein
VRRSLLANRLARYSTEELNAADSSAAGKVRQVRPIQRWKFATGLNFDNIPGSCSHILCSCRSKRRLSRQVRVSTGKAAGQVRSSSEPSRRQFAAGLDLNKIADRRSGVQRGTGPEGEANCCFDFRDYAASIFSQFAA